MKSTIQKIGVIIAIIWSSISACAYDFEVDGLYYNVSSLVDLTCEVTHGDKEYTGDIMIPEEIIYNNRKLTVISIGNDAFMDCISLTSINIPNSVTKIGFSAFRGCSSLPSVNIPDAVKAIG